jgi:hypothetical protein
MKSPARRTLLIPRESEIMPGIFLKITQGDAKRLRASSRRRILIRDRGGIAGWVDPESLIVRARGLYGRIVWEKTLVPSFPTFGFMGPVPFVGRIILPEKKRRRP